jgi:dCMP deaminase
VSRKDWDHYFMDIAYAVSSRSTCLKHHVGCVITKNERIVSTGYNGAVRGMKHCIKGCTLTKEGQCAVGIHAEQNAVAYAWQSLEGASAYVTLKPCLACAKLLIASGVSRIIYTEDTTQTDTEALCAGTDTVITRL